MTTVKPSYTLRTRQRQTRWTVRVMERVSRILITIGGIGTVAAVSLVCAFLVWKVVPLFLPATITRAVDMPSPWKETRPFAMAVDEYQLMGWVLSPKGALEVFRLDNGNLLEKQQLFEKPALTACTLGIDGKSVILGFADGSVRLGTIGFTTSFPDEKNIPAGLHDLKEGQVVEFQGGLATRTPEGQLRLQKSAVELQKPSKPAHRSPIRLIDHSVLTTGPVICTLSEDGKLRLDTVREQQNFLTGEVVSRLTGSELSYTPPLGKGPPSHLCLSGGGDRVYLAWDDGYLIRLDTRDPQKATVAEVRSLVEQPGVSLTALHFLISKETLVAGDSTGRVRAWFCIHSPGATTSDQATLVAAHELPGPEAAVTALAVSGRSRMLAVGYANGLVRLFNVTSEKFMAEVAATKQEPVVLLSIAPKDNGIVAATATGLRLWGLDPGYPETTVRSLFFPVWYEGYPSPGHTWQSSSGTDAFEPKFGLTPLIFGTVKATFYSLLFGVPLALLAAVYSSEFLHPRVKGVIKPTVELMASLPSVVLGFLAGLVFAPLVSQVVPAALTCFFTVPFAFLVGAYAWQMLPTQMALRLARWRVLFILAVLPFGPLVAWKLGPLVEQWLFAGNFKGWLEGQVGRVASGWMILLLPVSAVATAALMGRFLTPLIRRLTAHRGRAACAFLDLGRFLVGCFLALLVAGGMALGLEALGFDTRSSFFGRYDQRNAMVVGFIMGFAIIPIIYTLADDALSSVPEHLRSGSLACGATRWQTAMRIIIPTAMSGLFSAVMVGMGRAVGETMIVLMATGNTPVMEWNIFNGFRTLSANIAVELPEAPQDSTHYRTLFLAALILFILTFAVNTVAESVRIRFRRRAYQL